MSTSLLYHAFGVKGYHQSAIQFEAGAVIIRIEQPREKLCCSACGAEEVFAKGAVNRRFHTVPIGSKPVWIEFAVPRVRCRRCGLERQVSIPFAEPKKSYTKSFARYVLELSSHMTIQGVAQHLNVGWDLVNGATVVESAPVQGKQLDDSGITLIRWILR
jgi:transposase